MEADEFEGSIILEMLAEKDLLDEFMEAVDSDNFSLAIKLMKKAEIDNETIKIVLAKMQD